LDRNNVSELIESAQVESLRQFERLLTLEFSKGYVVLLGWAGSNSVVFGEYILNAANVEVNRWNQRGVGLACVTSAFLIHGCALRWGLRLQNLLGIIKLLILLLIIVSGFVALGGHLKVEKPDNFTTAFEGTTGSAYGIVTALYNVIWSYIGYSNANYALSETKNPVQTLKRAAPAALVLVSVLYMLCNVNTLLISSKFVADIFPDCIFCSSSQSRHHQLRPHRRCYFLPQYVWRSC
jgi:amino acid transporter